MADHRISEEAIAELMDAFNYHDTDKDGLISTAELGRVLRTLDKNPTEAELQNLSHAMDTNFSGTIDLPEFLNLMAMRMSEENMEEEILEAFKVFDKDGDGLISAREFRHVMANLGESLTAEEVEAFIKEADSDGDGKINYTEFFVMVSRSNDE